MHFVHVPLLFTTVAQFVGAELQAVVPSLHFSPVHAVHFTPSTPYPAVHLLHFWLVFAVTPSMQFGFDWHTSPSVPYWACVQAMHLLFVLSSRCPALHFVHVPLLFTTVAQFAVAAWHVVVPSLHFSPVHAVHELPVP